ncbi:MAG: O-antigen ligase family protein, partial [Aurantimicrobium sp.]
IARRRVVRWNAFLPISLTVFLVWCAVSYFWSYYPKASLVGIASQISFTLLALAVSSTRDTIQIIRATGDVLRIFLATSITLEIFAGVLIDGPINFLGIRGNLISGQGIQGVFGTRNIFVLVSLIALITFFVEWRTKSVSIQVYSWSMMGSALCVFLAASPVGYIAGIALMIIALFLFALRAMKPANRRKSEIVFVSLLGLSIIIIWAFRWRFLEAISSNDLLKYRLTLWEEELRLAAMKPIEGWGWVGLWPLKTQPFTVLNSTSGTKHLSGLNSFLDAWLQTGFIGLTLICLALLMAFLVLWKKAVVSSEFSSIWPALIIVTLITTSFAESFMLTEFGWFLLCICISIASRYRSIRSFSS